MKRVKPILLLTTKDGAIFQNSDPLSAAFAENSAIGSTIQEWIMPPMSQRYMETCAETKTSNCRKFIEKKIHEFIFPFMPQ